MHKRLIQLLALTLLFLAGGAWCTSDAMAADASPSQSIITTGSSSTTVDPYQSFSVSITLRDASGSNLTSAPAGKVYLWATDASNRISDGLDLVELSLGDNVYMHQTSRQGVLIMDAAALIQTQRFNLKLAEKGPYKLHALYMPTGSIDPNAVSDYWPYELTGSSEAERTITVNATPASDVAMMVVSTKIRGISVDSFLITGPRNQTLTTPISIDSSGATTTEVQLALLRDNGLSVGADVPIYINTTSNNVTVSNVLVRTNENGIARFTVSGLVSDNSTLQLRCDVNDAPVVIPLSAYEYRPERVRFDIGSNIIDVDGRTMEIDTAAVIRNGRTYVPYRAIGELLGARIEYDNAVRTITTHFDDSVLTMTVGYNHYAVDGTVYQMDAAPYINSDGRTMVPIRFVAEVIGYDVRAVTGSNNLTESVVFTRR